MATYFSTILSDENASRVFSRVEAFIDIEADAGCAALTSDARLWGLFVFPKWSRFCYKGVLDPTVAFWTSTYIRRYRNDSMDLLFSDSREGIPSTSILFSLTC